MLLQYKIFLSMEKSYNSKPKSQSLKKHRPSTVFFHTLALYKSLKAVLIINDPYLLGHIFSSMLPNIRYR